MALAERALRQLLQVGVDALGEPAVDRGEQVARPGAYLRLSQRQARLVRAREFEGFRLLALGGIDRPLQPRCRFGIFADLPPGQSPSAGRAPLDNWQSRLLQRVDAVNGALPASSKAWSISTPLLGRDAFHCYQVHISSMIRKGGDESPRGWLGGSAPTAFDREFANMNETSEPTSIAALTADIVSAYVSNNHIASSELGRLITTVAGQLSKVGTEPEQPTEENPSRRSPCVVLSARITSSALSAVSRKRSSRVTSRSSTT